MRPSPRPPQAPGPLTPVACVLFIVLGALGALGACGGDSCSDTTDSSAATCEALEVYVGVHPVDCGTSCPEGTEEAYRDANDLVCHACATADDCPDHLPRCEIACGPGCEDDTGGCCPVRDCR